MCNIYLKKPFFWKHILVNPAKVSQTWNGSAVRPILSLFYSYFIFFMGKFSFTKQPDKKLFEIRAKNPVIWIYITIYFI